ALNLMENFRSQVYFRELQSAAAQGSAADIGAWRQEITGLAALAGNRIGDRDVQAAINRLSTVTGGLMGSAGMFLPDLVDRLAGYRGSQGVLAQQLFRAGQYGYDPVTGFVGFSGASSAAMAQNIYQQLYGPGARMSDVHGLRAGQLGGAAI